MVIWLIIASYNEVPTPITSGADASLEDPKQRKY